MMHKNTLSLDWKTKNNKLVYEMECKNFSHAVELINDVAKIAEKIDHHPDLHLTGYRNFRIEIYTHDSKKMTSKDFQLADHFERLLAS